jgi:hypothetical protein
MRYLISNIVVFIIYITVFIFQEFINVAKDKLQRFI